MIILDTNVLSELATQVPEPAVIDWLDALPAGEAATTATTAAELMYGVAQLPAGRRRVDLGEAVRAMLAEDLGGRVLPFDQAAAGHYADIVCHREHLGVPISMADAQIAAICRSAGAQLATRDVKGFASTGVVLINPWEHT